MFTSKRVSFGKGTAVIALAVLACFALSGTAEASILPPGPGAFPPDIFSNTSGATLLASLFSGPVTASNGALTFTMRTAVYSDTNNVFCSGCLDFVYQVANLVGSTDSVGRVTAINFTGFSTDVGYFTAGSGLVGGGFVNGTVTPQLVDRVTASTVGFSFNAPLTLLIPPGSTSVVLAIQTNARVFGPGHVNIIDGGVSTVNSFQPVPEPASFALIGLGLLGLAGIRRMRRSV